MKRLDIISQEISCNKTNFQNKSGNRFSKSFIPKNCMSIQIQKASNKSNCSPKSITLFPFY